MLLTADQVNIGLRQCSRVGARGRNVVVYKTQEWEGYGK